MFSKHLKQYRIKPKNAIFNLCFYSFKASSGLPDIIFSNMKMHLGTHKKDRRDRSFCVHVNLITGLFRKRIRRLSSEGPPRHPLLFRIQL